MFLLLLAEPVVAAFLLIVSFLFNSKTLKKIGIHLLKEGFLTLILFNCFNFAFSAGVHWKYANVSDEYYLLSSLSLYLCLSFIVIVIFLVQLAKPKGYGEFKLKYKNNVVCRLYIALTLIFRISLGFYISLENDYEFGAFIIIGFSLSFLMYHIVNLPFRNVFHNYRAGLVHATEFIILMVTSYYRSMKSTSPLQVKSHYLTAAKLEIGMIVVCMIVSFLVLVYDLVKFCKWLSWKYCKSKQKIVDKQEKKIENINLTQE